MNRTHALAAAACRIGSLALLCLALAGPSRAETTYQYTGQPFSNVLGVYTTSDRVTGQFTTAAPLPANLAFQDVSGLVTSFSFGDGHQTVTEADIGSLWHFEFMVSTDSAGAIVDWRINLFFDGSDRLFQTVSDSFVDQDVGRIDLSNGGGVYDSPGSWLLLDPTVYQYAGEPFSNVLGSYTTSDRITGQFTTAAPLPANLAFQDVSGLVTSFSFGDGHQTVTEADIGSLWYFEFMVSTGSAGEIVDWRINLFFNGSDRLFQTVSDSFVDQDVGRIDLSNGGGVYDSPGSWWTQFAQVVAAASPAERALLAAGLLAVSAAALRRARWSVGG